MKGKYLIIASLILAVLTIGAAGAADANDDLAVDEGAQIEEAPVDEVVSADEEDALSINESDFQAEIKDTSDLRNFSDYVVSFYCPEEANGGSIYIGIDDEEEPDYFFNIRDENVGTTVKVSLRDLYINRVGTHYIYITFVKNAKLYQVASGYTNVTKSLSEMDFDYSKHSLITDLNQYIFFAEDIPADGNFLIYVDGELKCTKPVRYDTDFCVYPVDVGISGIGNYKIQVDFNSSKGQEFTLSTFELTVDPDYVGDSHISISDKLDILIPDSFLCGISFDEYLDGNVTVTVDGKQYFTEKYVPSYGLRYLPIYVHDLNLDGLDFGTYLVGVTFTANDGNVYFSSRHVLFFTFPDVYYPSYMSLGEKNGLIITGYNKFSGNFTLYNSVFGPDGIIKDSVFASGDIVNGFARVSFENLSLGTHQFIVDYVFGGEKDSYWFFVQVSNNTQGFSSGISASTVTVGDSFNVSFTGHPDELNAVYIDVDGGLLRYDMLNTGNVSQVISGLGVGTHYITIRYSGNGEFYSNTFIVDVKDKETPKPVAPTKTVTKLTLKKVKVKRSAKKLVLTATLKINGKAVKGKVIKFKFNKKTYKAKTNKKGIAKVTVKKAVLKKLKAGKKVKYQASYGKIVKKYTVKVRR